MSLRLYHVPVPAHAHAYVHAHAYDHVDAYVHANIPAHVHFHVHAHAEVPADVHAHSYPGAHRPPLHNDCDKLANNLRGKGGILDWTKSNVKRGYKGCLDYNPPPPPFTVPVPTLLHFTTKAPASLIKTGMVF